MFSSFSRIPKCGAFFHAVAKLRGLTERVVFFFKPVIEFITAVLFGNNVSDL